MTPFQTRQRGEGKLGCVVSLVVLIAVGAIAYKAFPVYYSNRELLDFAKDLGPKASGIQNPEAIEVLVRQKAKELEIPEVFNNVSAVSVSLRPSALDVPGRCTIKIRYKKPIDFFGVYTYVMDTNETVECDIYTNIR